ncbi:MAG: hypothetical protein SFU56_04060 [Capsulimonadales bacterium]|nr:hypothetical protein [Capsulimonadales bacterium]
MMNRQHAAYLTAFSAFALGAALPVRAQDTPPPATQDPAAPQNPANAQGGMLSQMVTTLNQQGNVTILADRSVASQTVAPLTGRFENVEQALTQLTRSLPTGTVWAKVYLPSEGTTTTSTRWNADLLTDYVLIQSRLFGTGTGSDATASAGAVEIMGKRLSGRDASNVVSALNLKPVYVIYNPTLRTNRDGQTAPGTTTTPSTETPQTVDPNAPVTTPAPVPPNPGR